MTELGELFAMTADSITAKYGKGSNKMTYGFKFAADEAEDETDTRVAQFNQLVKMGYLRKFVGDEYTTNRNRNWRYRYKVRSVYFGLTEKGWQVADQYLKVYEAKCHREWCEIKAKRYMDKVKNTNPISFEEALKLAYEGVL